MKHEIPKMIKKPRKKSAITMNFDAELKESCRLMADEIGISLTDFLEHAAILQLSQYKPELAKILFEELK